MVTRPKSSVYVAAGKAYINLILVSLLKTQTSELSDRAKAPL